MNEPARVALVEDDDQTHRRLVASVNADAALRLVPASCASYARA